MPVLFLQLSNQLWRVLSRSFDAASIQVSELCCSKSTEKAHAFSQIIASLKVSLASSFSVNHITTSFFIFSLIDVRCLKIVLTPFAGVMAFIYFWFSMMQIEVLRSYCFTMSTTCTPWLCFSIISFLNSMHIIRFFFSAMSFTTTFFRSFAK